MAIEVRKSEESKQKKLLMDKLLQKAKMTPEEIDALVDKASPEEMKGIVAEILKYILK